MPLIYSFVARGTAVLAEAIQPNYEGNFHSVAIQLLERCPTDTNQFVYPVQGHTFNFIVEDGFTFLVVADQASGRELPYGYLDTLKEEFRTNHAQRARTATTLPKSFSNWMVEKMDFLMEHPEETSRIKGLQRQVRDVQTVMQNNIDQVLNRGEKLDNLVVKTDELRHNADQFKKTGVQLRKKMYWQNKKWWCIIILVLIIIAVIIFISVCFSGGNCIKN